MKVKLFLDRKAQILAGIEPADDAIVDVNPADVPEHLRPILADPTYKDYGSDAVCPLLKRPDNQYPSLVVADLDGALAVLERALVLDQEARAKAKAKAIAWADRWAAQPDPVIPDDASVSASGYFMGSTAWLQGTTIRDRSYCFELDEYGMSEYLPLVPKDHPVFSVIERAKACVAKLNQWRREATEKTKQTVARVEAEAAERKAQEAAEKAETETRRQAQLADWATNHMGPVAARKFAAGLMDQDEIIQSIRDNAFAPLDHLPRYKKITRTEVLQGDDEEYVSGETEVSVTDNPPLTDDQFLALEAIRQLMPTATVTPREHNGYLGDECRVTRHSVLVSVPVGDLTLSRAYAL